MEGVPGRRALQQPPRDVDSVHVNVYPCLVDGVKGLVYRLLQARVADNLGKERRGGTAMNSRVEVDRFSRVGLVDVAPRERLPEKRL